jgi:hypothetical protein
MTAKMQSATPEEYVFAQEVNRRLVGTGASVHPFCMLDPETQARTYHMTMAAGSRRHTILADSPFHYDPPEDVVRRVHQWLAAAGAGERWTTDPEKADAQEI